VPLTLIPLVTGRFGYKADDIVTLTDDAKNPRQQPTKENIVNLILRVLVVQFRIDESGNGYSSTQCNGLYAAPNRMIHFSSIVSLP